MRSLLLCFPAVDARYNDFLNPYLTKVLILENKNLKIIDISKNITTFAYQGKVYIHILYPDNYLKYLLNL